MTNDEKTQVCPECSRSLREGYTHCPEHEPEPPWLKGLQAAWAKGAGRKPESCVYEPLSEVPWRWHTNHDI